jgi:hypothetical protein
LNYYGCSILVSLVNVRDRSGRMSGSGSSVSGILRQRNPAFRRTQLQFLVRLVEALHWLLFQLSLVLRFEQHDGFHCQIGSSRDALLLVSGWFLPPARGGAGLGRARAWRAVAGVNAAEDQRRTGKGMPRGNQEVGCCCLFQLFWFQTSQARWEAGMQEWRARPGVSPAHRCTQHRHASNLEAVMTQPEPD